MGTAQVGIIGGTGLGELLHRDVGGEPVSIDTPFGATSGPLLLTNWEGVDVAFLSRHGVGHRLNPSSVPYRANIWAFKSLGVRAIIASGATGSLQESIEPGHLVLCDQVIDKTFRRASTFFDEGMAVHVELAEPFCPRLRSLLADAGEHVETEVHPTGTYVCMEGPQFSTRAESKMHRRWGADLIGMTCMPEARLAREAEICYALVALPTDYDCWRETPAGQAGDQIMQSVLKNLDTATRGAHALIAATLRAMTDAYPSCSCHDALKLAIWTDQAQLEPAVRTRLALLIDRYMTKPSDAD